VTRSRESRCAESTQGTRVFGGGTGRRTMHSAETAASRALIGSELKKRRMAVRTERQCNQLPIRSTERSRGETCGRESEVHESRTKNAARGGTQRAIVRTQLSPRAPCCACDLTPWGTRGTSEKPSVKDQGKVRGHDRGCNKAPTSGRGETSRAGGRGKGGRGKNESRTSSARKKTLWAKAKNTRPKTIALRLAKWAKKGAKSERKNSRPGEEMRCKKGKRTKSPDREKKRKTAAKREAEWAASRRGGKIKGVRRRKKVT